MIQVVAIRSSSGRQVGFLRETDDTIQVQAESGRVIAEYYKKLNITREEPSGRVVGNGNFLSQYMQGAPDAAPNKSLDPHWSTQAEDTTKRTSEFDRPRQQQTYSPISDKSEPSYFTGPIYKTPVESSTGTKIAETAALGSIFFLLAFVLLSFIAVPYFTYKWIKNGRLEDRERNALIMCSFILVLVGSLLIYGKYAPAPVDKEQTEEESIIIIENGVAVKKFPNGCSYYVDPQTKMHLKTHDCYCAVDMNKNPNECTTDKYFQLEDLKKSLLEPKPKRDDWWQD